MLIRFAPRGVLEVNDARIVYSNFEGRGDKFNREGDRNFSLVIEEREPFKEEVDSLMDIYPQFKLQKGMMLHEILKELGWNVKIKPARDEEEGCFITLAVKVKFNDRGPTAYLKAGRNAVRLNEDTIGCLDQVDILGIDMDIRPYDWELPSGLTGRSAYLQAIEVIQRVDRIAERYANRFDDEEEVF